MRPLAFLLATSWTPRVGAQRQVCASHCAERLARMRGHYLANGSPMLMGDCLGAPPSRELITRRAFTSGRFRWLSTLRVQVSPQLARHSLTKSQSASASGILRIITTFHCL